MSASITAHSRRKGSTGNRCGIWAWPLPQWSGAASVPCAEIKTTVSAKVELQRWRRGRLSALSKKTGIIASAVIPLATLGIAYWNLSDLRWQQVRLERKNAKLAATIETAIRTEKTLAEAVAHQKMKSRNYPARLRRYETKLAALT